jgi:hypothetical protein
LTYISFQIKTGYIHYTYPDKTIIFDIVKVNDGKWHYIEVGWLMTGLVISLDYGQVKVSCSARAELADGHVFTVTLCSI